MSYNATVIKTDKEGTIKQLIKLFGSVLVKTTRPLFKSGALLSWIIYLGFVLLISACSSPTETETIPSATSTVASESTPVVATPTKTQAITPTSQSASVILITPSGVDPQLASDVETALTDLTAEDNLELQVLNDPPAEGFGGYIRLVVVLPPDPGVRDLAEEFPDTQFLAIGIPDIETGNNLSVIGYQMGRPDQQGFIAGYLAATLTPAWRVAVISTDDTGSGRAARGGFLNGAIFLCGLCRPSSAPFVEYPQFYDLTIGAGQEEQMAAVNYLGENAVRTVYVYPEVSDTSLLENLAESGIVLIGGVSPPDSVKEQWAATIVPDWVTPLHAIWPTLMTGRGGIQQEASIMIIDRNPNLFSLGRQRFVEQTLEDLLDGYIDTGVNPITGERY